MTLRQVFYQLVSRQALENVKGRYDALGNALRDARKDGTIPWAWMEDRTRRPRGVPMWGDLPDYAGAVRQSYRRDVWTSQARLVEVWIEKDSLSGIFTECLEPYGVTLNVGRGYDGWDSIHNAAERFKRWPGPATLLYFGDLDPSGMNIADSLGDRLGQLDAAPEIVICAITLADIDTYRLPTAFAKKTDTRHDGFVKKYGDVAVELDALPIDVLQGRIVREVERRIDMDALATVRTQETADRRQITRLLRSVA